MTAVESFAKPNKKLMCSTREIPLEPPPAMRKGRRMLFKVSRSGGKVSRIITASSVNCWYLAKGTAPAASEVFNFI